MAITAEDMARDMKEISVAEFFEKNKHFLGYENPSRSLLTVVKEAVDNALEFTTEAGILPNVKINLKQIGVDKFRVRVEDNGPGIVERYVPRAFAKVLYGSRFHKLKQSRSLFGIGIKGVCLYSQLTTGKPVKVVTSTGGDIHSFELLIDVLKNEPKVVLHFKEKNPEKWHGVKIEFEVKGSYTRGSHSIPEYIKQTAISNPYATIIYDGPDGRMKFKRTVKRLPKIPKEIRPHPYGIEFGILRRMLANTRTKNLMGFLMTDFSRVGKKSAKQMCRLARLAPDRDPRKLDGKEIARLHEAMKTVKLRAPPLTCLSPLTEDTVVEGMKKVIQADFYTAVTRPPAVYLGYPFQIEVCICYGGRLDEERTCQLYRFANKVPLLYHQGSCAITKAVEEVDWRRYGLKQSGGALPQGPIAILVHFASVWIPYTSEGKQAIANYPEIVREIKLALQDAGRDLASYIRKERKILERQLRRQIFERYLPEVARSLSTLTKKREELILNKLEEFIKRG